jgi:sulfatase maturation enzyme AslB (radical SAM superfamily)
MPLTPKDIITNRKFCPLPWTGLMYNHDGKVKNCIRSNNVIGNLQNNTIEEIMLGEQNIDRQTTMLKGIPSHNCTPCYDLEQNKTSFDVISDRIFYIKELKSVNMRTYERGNFDLHTIDVRWSNTCNFACVYCSPEFSSKWAGELGTVQSAPTEEQRNQFKEYILTRAANLKHVYMAGGEPLLMKENLELLETLQQVNPDVNLRINTNLSKVDTQVFDRVCKFKNVHWIVSVESIEEEFEYIRHGGSWLDFIDNLTVIQQLNHKISFNMLHFVLNYKSIFGCVDYLSKMGFHNNSFIIGALLGPEYLNIRNLPNHVLQSVKQTLTDRINEQPKYLLEDGYRNMLNHIEQPFAKNLANTFNELALVDQRRGLDSGKIFKDLYKLKQGNNHG